MRHRKSGRKLGRTSSHRKAMWSNMVASLVTHGRIETTEAKAKELRRVAERLITRAVRLGAVGQTPADKLSAADQARRTSTKRQVGRFLQRFATKTSADGESTTVDLQEKLLVELGKRYQGRPGGYTRIIKLGRRRGDNAPMTLIELVGSEASVVGEAKKSDKASGAEAETA
jgi:large subunit ribosomal protein L17